MKRSDATAQSQCPFNPAHLILNGRMANHIEQCRQNPNKKNVIRCTFNANHWYPPDKEEEHLKECDALASLKLQQLEFSERTFVPPLPEEHLQVQGHDTEDWDTPTDEGHQSYLAVKDEINQKKDIVQLGPTNVGKAERKKYLKEERERHNELQKRNNQ